jgi:aspartate carbamoyltransferase catalytic subunit
MFFKGQHLLSLKHLTLDAVNELFYITEKMRPYAQRKKRTHILNGAILGNLFFEPSTRTRISFGSAFNLLGGAVRETTGLSISALAKGESLYDTAHVLSGYCDIIAMRHPLEHSVNDFSIGSRVPVINGGDGANEHPTQALLDLFTIQSELKRCQLSMSDLTLTFLGDLKHARTVHSLCQLLALYKNLTLHLVAPVALQLPSQYMDLLTRSGHKIIMNTHFEDALPHSHVLYQTRVQEERFSSPEAANHYRGQYQMNKKVYAQYAKSNMILMHPLPRDSRPHANELDHDLNSMPDLAIFRQADNGLLIRMALFACILGVEHQLHQAESPITWNNGLYPS